MKKDTFRLHHYGLTAFPLMALLLLGAPVLLWSWNTVAAGLFHLPIMLFRHALAVELFLVVICLITGTALRLFMSGPGLTNKSS